MITNKPITVMITQYVSLSNNGRLIQKYSDCKLISPEGK